MQIFTKSVSKSDLKDIVDFDNRYLIDVFIELEIPKEQLPPSLTINDLNQAISRCDVLEWIFYDRDLAGYYWFELKPDHLYIAGLAIKPNFQGMGLVQWILKTAEEKAKEHQLKSCKHLAIPLNGRAVNAYLKYGYKITACKLASYFGPEYPNSYRFIMEKNLLSKEHDVPIDSQEIVCIDYELMENLTEQGYVGVQLIRADNQNDKENKIIFKKY
jgi:ribosomal protein S18 acetylase RimI-like enzyme